MGAIADMKNNLFMLPAASQIETSGTVTATNRATQWRNQVVEPMYECKTDHEILFQLAKKLGYYDELVRSWVMVKATLSGQKMQHVNIPERLEVSVYKVLHLSVLKRKVKTGICLIRKHCGVLDHLRVSTTVYLGHVGVKTSWNAYYV